MGQGRYLFLVSLLGWRHLLRMSMFQKTIDFRRMGPVASADTYVELTRLCRVNGRRGKIEITRGCSV